MNLSLSEQVKKIVALLSIPGPPKVMNSTQSVRGTVTGYSFNFDFEYQ